jgi:sugar phosphate isomerase/epimerase
MTMNRRTFLQTSSVSALAAAIAPNLYALAPDNAYRKNIGIQLYTLRDQIKADLAGTIKAVAEAGYRQVEPYGFPGQVALDMIKAAKDNGMQANSTHFDWESVTNPTKEGVAPFSEILGKAKDAGLTHLVVPYIHGHNRKNLDDYKRLAENCNKAAVESHKAGIQLAYHNHAFEYQPHEGGKTGYQVLMDEFAPEMMFEVDVFWVVVGGEDPVKQIQALKGRVSQLHLKDLKKDVATPNFGGVPKDAFQELGNGKIAMEPIIEAAADVGVAHCHVEQDQSPNPIASVQQSLKYLNGL